MTTARHIVALLQSHISGDEDRFLSVATQLALQLLEEDDSPGLIIAATNHPELLDKALFRRFDDVIAYDLPSAEIARGILESRLATFDRRAVDWPAALDAAVGLSQAEIARAADEAAKVAVLGGLETIHTATLLAAMSERRTAAH